MTDDAPTTPDALQDDRPPLTCMPMAVRRENGGGRVTLDAYPNHETWEQAYRELTSYGGTTAPAAIGVHPYKSQWKLWAQRLGIASADEVSERMEAGNYFEGGILARYSDKQLGGDERLIGRFSIVRHPENPLAHCSPDGIVTAGIEMVTANLTEARFVVSGAHARAKGGVDAKNHDRQMLYQEDPDKGYGAAGTDAVPMHIWYQCQWSCYVTGLPWWDVQACFGGNHFRTYRVHADPAIQKRMAEGVAHFHDHYVLGNVEPDFNGTKAREEFVDAFRQSSGTVEPVLAEELPLITQHTMLTRAMGRMKKARDAIEAAFMLRMRDTADLVIPGAGKKGADLPVVTWRQAKDGRPSIDYEKLAKRLEVELRARLPGPGPDDDVDPADATLALIRDECVVPGKPGSRRFLVKTEGKLEKLQHILNAASGVVDGAPSIVGDVSELLTQGLDAPEQLVDIEGLTNPNGEQP